MPGRVEEQAGSCRPPSPVAPRWASAAALAMWAMAQADQGPLEEELSRQRDARWASSAGSGPCMG
jgi:hypothetical protein